MHKRFVSRHLLLAVKEVKTTAWTSFKKTIPDTKKNATSNTLNKKQAKLKSWCQNGKHKLEEGLIVVNRPRNRLDQA
ncbi:hypothetical protein B14911_16955 [Bacillus sp. NRRL B-14911]|uniref:Uncharacterized protein n=1 Tax=Bacillus infantis NRRL B-14911 TaxID=1367477 RepID=U5L4Z3_9BACI|nr:hypothetical protein N288_03975 [Bacillus infantis NRRL B-14911]EAR67222.1 hypothetical protein B14911_16955 [Bacillus sp. NRRL B-14911]